MKSDRLYVEHILECIERIQRYCQGGGPSFLEQDVIQDAVLRNLQVLAESAKRVSGELKAVHPEIDWHGIAGFRNVLVHEYLGINLRRVSDIVTLDLPDLKVKMEALRNGLPPPG